MADDSTHGGGVPGGGPASRGGVWHFSPAQLAAALGCRMAREGELAAVILVTGHGGEETAVTLLPERDAAPALSGCVIGHRSGSFTSDVFSPPAEPIGREQMASRCAGLCRRVPVFAVHAAARLGPGGAASLIRRCLG